MFNNLQQSKISLERDRHKKSEVRRVLLSYNILDLGVEKSIND
ncbi:MAG TPA: hypothetical protein V6C71_12030 [Coleofasciculaceae cyanobacterium]